jgi:N4-gp56 family major capsid protein
MAVGRKADYTASIAQLWSRRLFAEAEHQSFWFRFEGEEGSGLPIIRKDDLTKTKGDTIKYDLVLALTGAGSTGDTALSEGNEEKLKIRQQSVAVDMWKHAVRWSDLADALITHDMRSTAKNQLAKRLAGKIDDDVWTEMTKTTQPTKNKWAMGTATSRDTVADTDAGGRLNLDSILELKAYAQVEMKVEPIRIGDEDEEYFYLVYHPYAGVGLKRQSDYKQANREARERGKTNPLFSGASFIWDGVIGIESRRVPRSNNANSPVVATADCVFFGAQAMCRGYARYPRWNEQDFSYGEEAGVQTNVIKGEKLNVFDFSSAGDGSDNKGIGSLVVYAAAVAPTQP